MRWVGHVEPMGGKQKCIQGFCKDSSGKEPLERPRRRWEDNIKLDFQEEGWSAWT